MYTYIVLTAICAGAFTVFVAGGSKSGSKSNRQPLVECYSLLNFHNATRAANVKKPTSSVRS